MYRTERELLPDLGQEEPKVRAAAAPRAEETPSSRTLVEVARRTLDVVVSATALLALSPLMCIIAALVKLDSPGPVLFRQTRIGIDRRRRPRSPSTRDQRRSEGFGRPFTLYKFRSMYVDARERFPELYEYRYTKEQLRSLPIKVLVAKKGDPEVFAAGDRNELAPALMDDPRVTPVGRWLRRTSLDELPNLLNVLLGDMHLVGPRPDIAENIRYYSPRHREKLRVKPGITGLAQINGRGWLTFEDTNEFDLAYLGKRSLGMDLLILMKTVPVLWKRDGAY